VVGTPEPHAALGAATALASLVALARRRRSV
jgi:MYXO-CTERM domain-containing protein